MKGHAETTVHDLLWILTHCLPPTEEIKIIDANDNDKSVIFNWRNNGYVLSCYQSTRNLDGRNRVAVGKICASRYSDDNAHILLEHLMNQNLETYQRACPA